MADYEAIKKLLIAIIILSAVLIVLIIGYVLLFEQQAKAVDVVLLPFTEEYEVYRI